MFLFATKICIISYSKSDGFLLCFNVSLSNLCTCLYIGARVFSTTWQRFKDTKILELVPPLVWETCSLACNRQHFSWNPSWRCRDILENWLWHKPCCSFNCHGYIRNLFVDKMVPENYFSSIILKARWIWLAWSH